MRSIWSTVRWIVMVGWVVVASRFAFDIYAAGHPDAASRHGGVELLMPVWLAGAYYLMPVVYLVAGLRRDFAGVRFGRFLLCCLMIGVLVWGLPNVIVYGTAQFQGWTFGRFTPGTRGPEIATSAIGKIGRALSIGAMTTIAGSIWTILWGTLLAWLPSRRRQGTAPGLTA